MKAGFLDLEQHGTEYLNKVKDALKSHRHVAIHGDAACGKSHLSRNLSDRIALSTAVSETTANIQDDPQFKAWLKKGKAEASILVIDEYNLAEPGTYDCLLGTHIECDGELIALTENHRVLFLGNASKEIGRNQHAGLMDATVTMCSPDPEHIVKHCANGMKIDQNEMNQLVEKVNAGASIRQIQTYCVMQKQSGCNEVCL